MGFYLFIPDLCLISVLFIRLHICSTGALCVVFGRVTVVQLVGLDLVLSAAWSCGAQLIFSSAPVFK